ncbi:MAG: O-antigen ligase family protein, partial [Caldilineaceae bacterium]|nr:O-antigen ligase family protein [Caldilineaceae bacterium]
TAGIIGIGVVASWSRGGWLGAMAGVGVVVFFRNRKTLLVMAGLAVVLLGALLLGSFSTAIVPSPIAERVQDLPQYVGGGDVLQQPVTDDNFAVIERLAHWVAALRMWNQSPWIGVGPGNYAVVYPTVQMPRWDDPLGHAHNIYLNVLAESGLIGLSAFLTLWLGTAAWLIRRRRQTASNAWANAYALGLLGMLAHLTVHNIFDNLFVQGIYLHLGILLACLESTRNEHVPAN